MCNIRWHVIITSISVVDLLIEAIIGEIVTHNASNSTDTNDFLNKLLTLGNLPANSLLVTHYILISHIMKVLMLVTIFYVLPLIIPFPLAHSVTSFA